MVRFADHSGSNSHRFSTQLIEKSDSKALPIAAAPIFGLAPPGQTDFRLRSGGFTILELLVVLVIAAIMVAVTPPLISSALPGVELKSAARKIAANLRMARSQAISSRAETTFSIDVEERLFSVSGSKRTHTLPADMKISLLTVESETSGEDAGAIRFFPQGGSTGGRVTLSQDKREYAVDVDWLTGRIRILE